MTLEVVHRHEKLASKSGVEFMAPISGADFCGVCQGPKITLERPTDQIVSLNDRETRL